jgi:hypothetical protein
MPQSMELIFRHLFNDLFLILIFLFPVTLLLGGLLLLALLVRKNGISNHGLLIPILLFFTFVIIYFLLVVFDSSGFIRFIFTLAVVLATILSVMVAIAQIVHYGKKQNRHNSAIFIISAVFIVTSGVTGRLASGIITTQCEEYHLVVGDVIVHSLENYYSDNKVYPNNLLELIPKYINRDSIKTCYSVRFWQENLSLTEFEGFYYKKCLQGRTELIIPGMGSGEYDVYDLSEKTWYVYNGEPIGEFGRLVNCQYGE